MKKFSKLYLSTGLAINFLITSAVPAYAVGICPDPAKVGTGFDALCKKEATLSGIVQLVVNLVLFVGLVAALVFLIIGGIKWIMSGGDKAQTETAKNAVTSALIGLAVVVGAYILINVVLSFFGISGVSAIIAPNLKDFNLNQ